MHSSDTTKNLVSVRRALWGILLLKLVATIAKLVVGYLTLSLALVADGFNSIFDGASSVVALIGVSVAARPADEDHPYGHRKAETMATLVISTLLFITAWELGKGAIGRLRDPASIQTEVNVWSFVAMLVSLVLNAIILAYALPQGRRLRSEVLAAAAMDTRIDVLIAISIIVGLAAISLGYPVVDPLLALVLALLIAKTGLDIIRSSFPTLLDQATLPSDEVTRIALSVPGVISVHQVRSRGHETAVFADLHIRVDPGTPTEEAHAVAHEVQNRLRKRQPDIQDVTIHVEPAGPAVSTKPQEAMALRIRRIASGLGLSVHDIWTHTVKDRHCIEVHLEADGSMPLREAHDLASVLEDRMHGEFADLSELTTHLEPRGQLVADADRPGPHDPPTDVIDRISDTVCHIVDTVTAGETCHSMRVYRQGDGWGISFHCRLPGEMPLAEAHERCCQIEGHLRRRIPSLGRVIIHTEPRRS